MPQRPLQIYIMVGQSNMQGHGWIDVKDEQSGEYLVGTLEWMIQQEEYSNLHLKDDNDKNKWIEHDDVYIAYNNQYYCDDIEPIMNEYGKLTIGRFGGEPEEEKQQMIGPEVGFGWTLGDSDIIQELQQPILLLKIAWGGKSLAEDYRPPSSGGTVGTYYKAMINNIHTTLDKLSTYFPNPLVYDPNIGYEIIGFIWHQGWNDGNEDHMVKEYEMNLKNLIHDIRIEFNVPDLLVVIGNTGQCGIDNALIRAYGAPEEEIYNRDAIMNAQMSMNDYVKYPDFQDTVLSINTTNFARNNVPSDCICHWNNNSESYWLVGQAMGKAMIQLLEKKKERDEENK